MAKSIVTPIGRASFPHLDKPNMYGKYALGILLLKSNPKVAQFVQWLKQAVRDEALSVAGEQGLQAAMREFQAFKDGDNQNAFKTYRAEYAGHWVLNVSRKTEFGKPCVVNRHKQPIDATEIYAGCDVLAFIDVFGYKYGTKKSVSIGVQHVMKVADNEPFSASGVSAESAFDDIDLPEDTGANVGFGTESPAPQVNPNVAPQADPFGGTGVAPAQHAPSTSTDPFSGV